MSSLKQYCLDALTSHPRRNPKMTPGALPFRIRKTGNNTKCQVGPKNNDTFGEIFSDFSKILKMSVFQNLLNFGITKHAISSLWILGPFSPKLVRSAFSKSFENVLFSKFGEFWDHKTRTTIGFVNFGTRKYDKTIQ